MSVVGEIRSLTGKTKTKKNWFGTSVLFVEVRVVEFDTNTGHDIGTYFTWKKASKQDIEELRLGISSK